MSDYEISPLMLSAVGVIRVHILVRAWRRQSCELAPAAILSTKGLYHGLGPRVARKQFTGHFKGC